MVKRKINFKMAEIGFKKHGYKKYIFMILIVILYFLFTSNLNISILNFFKGLPFIWDFLKRMFPPDLTNLPLFLKAAWQTIEIAFIGTIWGTIFAFIFGFFSARNVIGNKVIRQIAKTFMDICRGVSEIIWALIFVAMVGLGPFPGVLALTVHLTGALGRFFSETIENCRPNIIEGIKSTGANKLQIISHAIIPEVKPLFTNYIFYYFEHNIRAATVLGLVGAGGIGVELVTRIRLFRYQEVLTILIIIVLMVVIFDRISAFIRRKSVLSELK